VFLLHSSFSSGPRLKAGVIVCAVLCFALSLAGCAGYVSQPNTVAVGALSLSASSFDFKTVAVGQTAQQTLTVSNTGQAPVQLTGLSVSNKQFAVTGPSIPRTILPSNSLSYTITFSPTASGNASGTLTIASDAKNGMVSLAGVGQQAFANLAFNPPSINFGNLALAKTSTQNVTVQNSGDVNVTIQGITVAGAGFGYSSISPGVSLAPNQQATFQVWFTPKTAGAASATVSFLSANLSSPETLSLSGAGVGSSGSGTPPPTTGSHTVHLTWGASTSQIIGYRVYRSEVSGGSFTALNGTAVTTLTYDDSTVALGTTYYYVVTAVDASGNESIHSNQVTAVIPAT